MRPLLMLALALAVIGTAGTAGAAPAVDLFGYYFLDGAAPAGFQDIDHLHLSTIDEKDGQIVTVPLHGFIRMKAEGKAKPIDHVLVDLKLDGKKLSFSTKPQGIVSYRFAGTFTKLGNFPEDPPQGVILQGHLIKMQGEQKAAEAEVRFAYEAGG
jgi:hypothetical protein